MTRFVRPEQEENAELPMLVTLLPMTTLFSGVPAKTLPALNTARSLQSVTEVSLVQEENAELPMEVTLAGMVTEARALQR